MGLGPELAEGSAADEVGLDDEMVDGLVVGLRLEKVNVLGRLVAQQADDCSQSRRSPTDIINSV